MVQNCQEVERVGGLWGIVVLEEVARGVVAGFEVLQAWTLLDRVQC